MNPHHPPRRGRHNISRHHMTLNDLLNDLNVSRSTFHDWRTKGRAPRCLKLPNGELRIRKTDYEAWLKTLESEGR
jgi:predicted site-specific integrase-resolvase